MDDANASRTVADLRGLTIAIRPFGTVFVGPAPALVGSWLILAEWIPTPPRHTTYSHDRKGWWGKYDDDRWAEAQRPPHVGGWSLTRAKDGVLAFRLDAKYFRVYRGGPIDAGSHARAAEWHQRMVRARQDIRFRRFLDSAGIPIVG